MKSSKGVVGVGGNPRLSKGVGKFVATNANMCLNFRRTTLYWVRIAVKYCCAKATN